MWVCILVCLHMSGLTMCGVPCNFPAMLGLAPAPPVTQHRINGWKWMNVVKALNEIFLSTGYNSLTYNHAIDSVLLYELRVIIPWELPDLKKWFRKLYIYLIHRFNISYEAMYLSWDIQSYTVTENAKILSESWEWGFWLLPMMSIYERAASLAILFIIWIRTRCSFLRYYLCNAVISQISKILRPVAAKSDFLHHSHRTQSYLVMLLTHKNVMLKHMLL